VVFVVLDASSSSASFFSSSFSDLSFSPRSVRQSFILVRVTWPHYGSRWVFEALKGGNEES